MFNLSKKISIAFLLSIIAGFTYAQSVPSPRVSPSPNSINLMAPLSSGYRSYYEVAAIPSLLVHNERVKRYQVSLPAGTELHIHVTSTQNFKCALVAEYYGSTLHWAENQTCLYHSLKKSDKGRLIQIEVRFEPNASGYVNFDFNTIEGYWLPWH